MLGTDSYRTPAASELVHATLNFWIHQSLVSYQPTIAKEEAIATVVVKRENTLFASFK